MHVDAALDGIECSGILNGVNLSSDHVDFVDHNLAPLA